MGAVAGADIEGELDLAALVEALADFMLEVTAGGGSSGSDKSWHGRGNDTESVEGSVHVLGGGDGTLIRVAMEGFQDFGTDG